MVNKSVFTNFRFISPMAFIKTEQLTLSLKILIWQSQSIFRSNHLIPQKSLSNQITSYLAAKKVLHVRPKSRKETREILSV
jgi:hypothetical protein